MRTEEPRAISLKDYRAPDYRISEIAIDFALDPRTTRVTARTKVVRVGAEAPLVLNGEHLKLVSVAIDGHALSPDAYRIDEDSLAIARVPEIFALEIVTEISPAENTALEGLYTSKGIFCTQ
jgi:aminopeptidase N